MKERIRRVLRPQDAFSDSVQRLMRLSKRSDFLSRLYSWLLARRFGCYVSNLATVGARVWFPHPTGVVVGEGVVLEDDCVIYQNVTIGRSHAQNPVYPVIGSGSVVYAGAVVVGETELLPGTVVGANAVVLNFRGGGKGVVLVGAPARPAGSTTGSTAVRESKRAGS